MLKAQGHRAFKAKIGGASLDEDMARLRVIREVIGDEDELMLDVNGAWDLPTAIEGARLLKEIRPRWLEEPVRWFDDRRELRILAQKTDIPLSAGESEQTGHGVRALFEEQAIDIVQFDCTRMGGFTMGKKLAAFAGTQPRGNRSAPRLLHPRPHRGGLAGGLHRGVLHGPRARSAPGRIVREPAPHRERDASFERCAGSRAHALRRGDREVRNADCVSISTRVLSTRWVMQNRVPCFFKPGGRSRPSIRGVRPPVRSHKYFLNQSMASTMPISWCSGLQK